MHNEELSRSDLRRYQQSKVRYMCLGDLDILTLYLNLIPWEKSSYHNVISLLCPPSMWVSHVFSADDNLTCRWKCQNKNEQEELQGKGWWGWLTVAWDILLLMLPWQVYSDYIIITFPTVKVSSNLFWRYISFKELPICFAERLFHL